MYDLSYIKVELCVLQRFYEAMTLIRLLSISLTNCLVSTKSPFRSQYMKKSHIVQRLVQKLHSVGHDNCLYQSSKVICREILDRGHLRRFNENMSIKDIPAEEKRIRI